MRVTLESTTKIVKLVVGGAELEARIWEGTTESGIKVHALITRIAAHKDDDLSQFEAELREQRPPTNPDINSYPARLVL